MDGTINWSKVADAMRLCGYTERKITEGLRHYRDNLIKWASDHGPRKRGIRHRARKRDNRSIPRRVMSKTRRIKNEKRK